MNRVSIRFRIDLGKAASVGPGKIALLEAIARTGSLSQAGRDLKMSYRRSWLLLDSLNKSFRRPVAVLSKGGRGGGGANLTPFGKRLVAAYRGFESSLLEQTRSAFVGIARDAVGAAASKARRRPVKKTAPP
jgi:molybdate transport system regulatory protein